MKLKFSSYYFVFVLFCFFSMTKYIKYVLKMLLDKFNTRVRYNIISYERMFKDNCNIGKKIILSTFYPEERKYSKLRHFFACSFASLVLRAPQNGVFKTTISWLSDKIEKILAITFNVCPVRSAN